MAKKEITIEVSKEAYELAEGMANFVGVVRHQLSDGWNSEEDFPAIISAAMSNLVQAIEGLTELDDEWREDRAATVRAFALAGSKFGEQMS